MDEYCHSIGVIFAFFNDILLNVSLSANRYN